MTGGSGNSLLEAARDGLPYWVCSECRSACTGEICALCGRATEHLDIGLIYIELRERVEAMDRLTELPPWRQWSVHRSAPEDHRPGEQWDVQIHDTSTTDADSIYAEGATLAEATAKALDQLETPCPT